MFGCFFFISFFHFSKLKAGQILLPRVPIDPQIAESRQSLTSRDRILFGKSNRLVATFLFSPASGEPPSTSRPHTLRLGLSRPCELMESPQGLISGLGRGSELLIKLWIINWLMGSNWWPLLTVAQLSFNKFIIDASFLVLLNGNYFLSGHQNLIQSHPPLLLLTSSQWNEKPIWFVFSFVLEETVRLSAAERSASRSRQHCFLIIPENNNPIQDKTQNYTTHTQQVTEALDSLSF